jgi:hypothetical protein
MQTTVETNPPIGVAGQLATEHDEHNALVDSGTNEEAAANIPFGVMCKRGTVKGRIKLPTAAADVLDGILVHANEFDPESQLADATVNTNVQSAIKPGITGGLLKQGTILVIPEATNASAAAEVHMRIAASGGNTQLGSFTPTAEAAATVDLTPFARWVEPPVAGQPTPLWIDLVNSALAAVDA